MKRHVLAAAVLAFASLTANAATSPAAAEATGSSAGEAKEKVKCTRHRETGSNRTKKVCMSTERWNSLSPEERDAVIRSDKGAAVLDG